MINRNFLLEVNSEIQSAEVKPKQSGKSERSRELRIITRLPCSNSLKTMVPENGEASITELNLLAKKNPTNEHQKPKHSENVRQLFGKNTFYNIIISPLNNNL